MTRDKRYVYITTVQDDGLRGAVCDAATGAVLAFSERINPPHQSVARARAAELYREHAEQWHLIDEPKEGA